MASNFTNCKHTFVQNISVLGKQKKYTICMIFNSLFLKTICLFFFNHIKIYIKQGEIKYIWALILRKSSKKEVEEKQHQHNMCNTVILAS